MQHVVFTYFPATDNALKHNIPKARVGSYREDQVDVNVSERRVYIISTKRTINYLGVFFCPEEAVETSKASMLSKHGVTYTPFSPDEDVSEEEE